jgi:hypothetical protein
MNNLAYLDSKLEDKWLCIEYYHAFPESSGLHLCMNASLLLRHFHAIVRSRQRNPN